MLSEKKCTVITTSIEFLGMKITDGTYQPGAHLAEELKRFPEANLSVKEIQQFLGIVNYLRDFIPNCSAYTSQLSKLLRKNPSPWRAVRWLKQACKALPPLRIPGTGKRILQTDASDDYWGAVLLESEDGKEYYCGHASGQFKDSEKHYHAVYKEILAVKNGIKKFEFHLIGHQFIIRMDNTSFPQIMELRGKGVPDKQLLRLNDWFSKYQFTVQHVKGKTNVVPDYLSRRQPVQMIKPPKKLMIFSVNSPRPPDSY